MVPHGFRVSASLVVALRSLVSPLGVTSKSVNKTVAKLESNIKVLILRRGQNDKMLPGADVFPGGNAEPSDFSPEWLDLYAANGFNKDSFNDLQLNASQSSGHSAVKDGLPPWLGFRLSAIRETFEECGILLCRSPAGQSVGSPWTSFAVLQDIQDWQKRVWDDPHQMLALCQSKGCVPDVWGLHAWSNWLTPPHFKKRHNTVFYLAVLGCEPPHFLDLREMDRLTWTSPCEILEGSSAGTMSLMNPQMYEISRLAQFSSAESLAEFAAERSKHGCSVWMPVSCAVQDGLMFLLPGDSDYPVNPEECKTEMVHNCTMKEAIRAICDRQGSVHRCARRGRGIYCERIFVHNYNPTHCHVLPVSSEID